MSEDISDSISSYATELYNLERSIVDGVAELQRKYSLKFEGIDCTTQTTVCSRSDTLSDVNIKLKAISRES